MVRISLLVGVLAASLAVAGAADAKPKAKGKKKKPYVCHVQNEWNYTETIARHGEQKIVVADIGEDDELYGAPQGIFACRRNSAKPVMLSDVDGGTSIALRNVRWQRYYVAYTQTGSFSQCTKYEGSSPECEYGFGAAYDLRTGKRKATFPETDLERLVLSTKGWVAVVGRPDATGARTLYGADQSGVRTLAQGAVDPASVSFTGAVVHWTLAGVAQEATLGPVASR
jgi:hypothetical protein